MKFIHTSDWHLGLEFSGHNRLREHREFLNWLTGVAIEHQVDALLVAGDIYDVINPSVEAQRVFSQFIVNLKNQIPHINIVVIAGNHDSGHRIEIPREFGNALGNIHFVGSYNHSDNQLDKKHVIALLGENDKLLGHCLAIPFLRPLDMETKLQEGEDQTSAYNRSIKEVFTKLKDHAKALDQNVPLMAMGHLTTFGSKKGKSERELIGGLESVPSSFISEEIDYVALGHIHRAQAVSVATSSGENKTKIQYSGSPIPINFDERDYKHQVMLVEIEKNGETPTLQSIPIPRFVEFIRFGEDPKTWEETKRAINSYDWSPWKELEVDLRPFVDIQYLADAPVGTLREDTLELERKWPFRLCAKPRGIGVVKKETTEVTETKTNLDLTSDNGPVEIFKKLYLDKFNQAVPRELSECFTEILNEVVIEGKK
jgi:exonuclease SbcD